MMFNFNPLQQYHTTMRMSRASGYPNIQFMVPHPYEMAMQSIARRQPYQSPYQQAFRYDRGRGMRRMQIKAAGSGYQQGIGRQGPIQSGYPPIPGMA